MDDIWNELTVKIPTEDTERAAAICSMAADAGIYIEDYSDLEAEVQEIAHIDLIEKDLLEKDRTHSLIHLYLKQERALTEAVEFLKERFAAEGIAYELHTEDVREGTGRTTGKNTIMRRRSARGWPSVPHGRPTSLPGKRRSSGSIPAWLSAPAPMRQRGSVCAFSRSA
jgi:hypothetical protein